MTPVSRAGHRDRTKTAKKKLSVPIIMSRAPQMAIALSRASAIAQRKKSMRFQNLTWLTPNQPREIASRPVPSKWVGIGGASKAYAA